MKEPRSIAIPTLLAALALTAGASNPAWADEPGPSFDCKKAVTPIEKTLCNDEFAGFRDGALARLYSGLVDALTDSKREALRRSQRQWLKTRDRTCNRVGVNDRANCLITMYDKRLHRLGRQMRLARLGPIARGLVSIAGNYGDRMKNFSGSITVVEVPKGPAWIEISTVSGRSAHICNLWTNQARREGNRLVWRDAEEAKCEVTLTFKARSVRTKATRACRALCGANGYFEDITYTKATR